MADQVLTKQKLIDADEDAQSLDDFINGGDEQIVVTRLLKEYPTLANAIRQIYEKGGKFYPTLAAANADIANIRTDVYVITGDNGAYYKATAGATTLTKSPYDPLTQAKIYVDDRVIKTPTDSIYFADKEGFALFGMESISGKTTIESSDDTLSLKSRTEEIILGASSDPLILSDNDGFSIFISDVINHESIPSNNEVSTTKNIVAELESNTTALMGGNKKPYKQPIAPLKKGLNIFIVYGQSLSVGTEAYTVVTRTPSVRGNLMLGDSPRGKFSNPDATYLWETMGGSNVYKPLVETAQDQSGNIVDLDSFTMQANTFGETVLSGMLESIKDLHNRDAMVTNDTNVVLAGSCVGAAGATINTFIKSANKYFSRFQGCLQAHKEAALAAGYADVQVAGLVYMQGESDSSATKETYLANLTQLRADMVSEVKTVFGQPDDPAFFLYQIGGLYPATTSTNMGTSEAQLSFAENDGVFLLDNEFGYPAPNMHMYANSYRWLGCRFSKTIYNVLKNRKEITFKINDAVYFDGCVYVSFNVPDAPLKTQTVYNRKTPVNLTNLGFYVRNSASQGLNISSVTLASPSVYKITLAEPITDQLSLFFGSSYTQGVHNVCDSSQELAVFNWQYYGDKQQQVGENIADLVNKPYLLNAKPAVQFIKVRNV